MEEVYEIYDDSIRRLIESPHEKIFPVDIADNFQKMHARIEILLVKLLDFFDLAVDAGREPGDKSGTEKHRYHAAVVEAFTKEDNPLKGILGQQQPQAILRAWRLWRNKWVRRESDGDIAEENAMNNFKKAAAEMSLLMERLREAVSLANTYAREGVQVIQSLTDDRVARILQRKGGEKDDPMRNQAKTSRGSGQHRCDFQSQERDPGYVRGRGRGQTKGRAHASRTGQETKAQGHEAMANSSGYGGRTREWYPWMDILSNKDSD